MTTCSRCLRPVPLDDRGLLRRHLNNNATPCPETKPRPEEVVRGEQPGMFGGGNAR